MKKIIIFLILLVILNPIQTNAKTTKFYEAEYIDNIWQTKITPNKSTKYYQTARFFREEISNTPAYCIEPFIMFKEEHSYESTLLPDNLTNEQITRMKQLAYLGYNSNNRSSNEWYAVTQLLIWKTAVPTGEYYFTEGLTGPKTNKFQNLIDELNNDVEQFNNNPEFQHEYKITTKDSIKIEINNNNLNYKSNNKYVKIENNIITINNLPIGTHEIIVTKEDPHNDSPIIFYQSQNSQNIMTLGTIEPQEIKFKVIVLETEIKINKIDAENKENNNNQATLEGTTFQLYDENMKEITKLKIDKSLSTNIKNLPFGTYYIKEILAGKGYKLDNTLHKIIINQNNPKIELKIKNNIIKAILELTKNYKENNKLYPEKNITFNIYDNKGNLFKNITTNKSGYVSVELPYGTYLIEQKNTTEGYEYIEPFTININDESTVTYNLINNKIIGKLEINKVLEKNNQLLPEENITFNIYDNKGNLFKDITTNKSGYASVELPYGTYLIKQKNTTEGYKYIEPFTINIKDKSTLTYNLTNTIIKGKLEITKKLEENNQLLPEKNIVFNIYDNENNFYKEIITDEHGNVTTELPYGTYLIKQKNTTDGYDYIEPFIITIKDDSTLTYNLINYKIKVPNTYNEQNKNTIQKLLKIILEGFINAIKIYHNNYFYYKNFNTLSN